MATKWELSKELKKHVKECDKCRMIDSWNIILCKVADRMQQDEIKGALLD